MGKGFVASLRHGGGDARPPTLYTVGRTPPPRADTPPPRADTPPPRADTPPPRADTPPPRGGLGRNSDYVRETSQAVDAAIAAVAAKQWGNVTRRQLLDAGADDDAIGYRVKVGRLHRIHRGVYSVGRRALSPHERASAAVLACGPGAALGFGSAMALWGLWRHWDEPFEVVVRGDRRPPRVAVHRSTTLAWRDVRNHLGIRVTSPARTVFDIAPRLTDRQLTRTVSNALHSRWLNESALVELVGRLSHFPQANRIAPLLGLPGTPPRSGWEDDFPAFCEQHGLPTPVIGAVVCGFTVDALFVEEKLIVELDSWEFHKDPIAFQADRERDAETLAAGFATLRITWRRIEQAPLREAERLRMILKRRQALRRAR
jgi:hypothetical protein